jgi:hypothetical protein
VSEPRPPNLGGAVFAPRSKLASMFKHCVSRAAIDALAAEGRVESTARPWWPGRLDDRPRHDHQLPGIAGDNM